MSEWITDRLPTAEDAYKGYVWISIEEGQVNVWPYRWEYVKAGEAWMPLQFPKPYEKPTRWKAYYTFVYGVWCLQDIKDGHLNYFDHLTTNDEETANKMKRIAEVFNEVFP